jgi:GntR family transcriptional regulator, N-acetylglucosamine utilization regulator
MAAFTVDRNSPIPYYFQIEEWLHGQITSGALKPGDMLPSEIGLSEQLGVSRITIRQAFSDLTNEGLLVRRRAKGTYIAHRRRPVTFQRDQLRGVTEEMANMGLSVHSTVLEQSVVPAAGEVMFELELPLDTQVILIRRLRFVQNLPVVIETEYHPYPRFRDLLNMDLSDCSIYEILEQRYDARPVDARDRLTAEMANREQARLLRIDPGAPVLRSKRTAKDKSGQVMEFTISIYRADQYQFVIEYRGENK